MKRIIFLPPYYLNTRVYEESSRLRNIFHEGMSTFWMDVLIKILSLPCNFRKIDVILHKEKGHSIKLFLHVGSFRVKSPSAIRTFDLFFAFFSCVLVLSWARGLIQLLVFLLWFGSFKLSLLVLLLTLSIHSFGSSSKTGLILGGYDDSHLEKHVTLIGERVNEWIESRNLWIRDCKLPDMKGGHKNLVIWAKFRKGGRMI